MGDRRIDEIAARAAAAPPEVSPGVLPGELEPAVAAGVPTARRADPLEPPPASVVCTRCGDREVLAWEL